MMILNKIIHAARIFHLNIRHKNKSFADLKIYVYGFNMQETFDKLQTNKNDETNKNIQYEFS